MEDARLAQDEGPLVHYIRESSAGLLSDSCDPSSPGYHVQCEPEERQI